MWLENNFWKWPNFCSLFLLHSTLTSWMTQKKKKLLRFFRCVQHSLQQFSAVRAHFTTWCNIVNGICARLRNEWVGRGAFCLLQKYAKIHKPKAIIIFHICVCRWQHNHIMCDRSFFRTTLLSLSSWRRHRCEGKLNAIKKRLWWWTENNGSQKVNSDWKIYDEKMYEPQRGRKVLAIEYYTFILENFPQIPNQLHENGRSCTHCTTLQRQKASLMSNTILVAVNSHRPQDIGNRWSSVVSIFNMIDSIKSFWKYENSEIVILVAAVVKMPSAQKPYSFGMTSSMGTDFIIH